MWVLSLSLSRWIFVLSYNSHLGWWFFLFNFNMCFDVVFYKFPIKNPSYNFGWILVWINTWFLLEIIIWVYIKTKSTWVLIQMGIPIVWIINYYKVYILFLWFHFNFGYDNIIVLWWVLIIMMNFLFLKSYEIRNLNNKFETYNV